MIEKPEWTNINKQFFCFSGQYGVLERAERN